MQYDLASVNDRNVNQAEVETNGNNPQQGGKVPQAFKDKNLNTVPDGNAFSGYVSFLCPYLASGAWLVRRLGALMFRVQTCLATP